MAKITQIISLGQGWPTDDACAKFSSLNDLKCRIGGCIPPPELERCWHDTWFHWKSSPKIFSYCTL